MEKFTTEQRVKIIEFYFENGRSIVATQRSYMRNFNVRHPPSRPAIMNLVARFQEYGSVSDKPRSGRGRSVRTRENTEAAKRTVALKRIQPHPLEGVLKNLASHGVLCSVFKETCTCTLTKFN